MIYGLQKHKGNSWIVRSFNMVAGIITVENLFIGINGSPSGDADILLLVGVNKSVERFSGILAVQIGRKS